MCNAVLATLTHAMLATLVAAQTTVTQADIQRLQDGVFEAGSDLSRLRTGDAELRSELLAELDELRDEVIYLKVKLRKREPLTRSDYGSVRDRIEDVRRRASGENTVAAAGLGPGATAPVPAVPRDGTEFPAGTETDVRLLNSISSGTAQVEDRFEATTLVDLTVNERIVIPAGSLVRGVVTAVAPATPTNRTGTMTLGFDQITVNYRTYPIRATVASGGGAITEGQQVEHRSGTVLRVRFDAPVTIFSR